MKAITQRVSSAKVCIKDKTHASIKKGILAYVCFEQDDNEDVIDKFINKILNYNFFEEDTNIMSASLKEIEGELDHQLAGEHVVIIILQVNQALVGVTQSRYHV